MPILTSPMRKWPNSLIKRPMRILGIDPGLKATGYGFIDVDGNQVKLKEAGVIEPKSKDLIQNRIFKIHQNLNELLLQHKPDVMVLEKLYAHYKHPVTAAILGHARGVICLLCAERQVPLKEYSVKRIRQALTGNGNATKQQTLRVVSQTLHINESQLTLDASDALALALGHVHMVRARL